MFFYYNQQLSVKFGV